MLFNVIEIPWKFRDDLVFPFFLWLWIISIVVIFTASICIEIVLFQLILIYLNVRLRVSLILFFYTIGHLSITAALLVNFTLSWNYYIALFLFVFLYSCFPIGGIFAALVEVTKDYF